MKILGIDLGSTTVKAVEIDSAFGRFEIHEYHEQPVLPGANPLEAAEKLVQGLAKAPDRITVAMRSGQVTFRNLLLPTKDKKAIQSSIGFELEDDLPFPADQSVYDYSVLSQQGPSTHVHVAATLHRHAETTLEKWKAGGVDPDLLTTEAWALRTYFNRVVSIASQEKPLLLAILGHERTLIYAQWRGYPIMAREVSWGGRDLTTAICRKYGIPLEQAEKTKIDNGFVLPPSQLEQSTPEQREFSETLLEPIRDLLRALRQAELTCKSVTHQGLEKVYLSGGTSLLPGLARLLDEELQIPTQPLQSLSAIAGTGVSYSEHTDATFAMAMASALCLVGADRSTAINLRKGALTKQGAARGLNIGSLRGPLIGLGIVLTSLFVSLGVQSYVYKGRLEEANTQLEKSVKSFFGNLSGSALRNYISRPSELRSSVTKELTKQKELNKLLGANPRSPLAFLKELSSSIPRDVVVDMTEYKVGSSPSAPYVPTEEGNASLTFLVANPQMAEKLATLLGAKLEGIQRSKTEEVTVTPPEPAAAASPAPGAPAATPPGPMKRWKVTFSGKPTEDAYGK